MPRSGTQTQLGDLTDNTRNHAARVGSGCVKGRKAWWFRSCDEVWRQAASDREVLDSDLEEHENSTYIVVCASF